MANIKTTTPRSHFVKLEEDDQKRIIKEALKEWLNEKFTEFGKWTLAAFGAALFVAMTYFVLYLNGWHK